MIARTPKVIIVPTEEPISIEEARAQINLPEYADSDVDDIDNTMIEGWLAAAREHCEEFLGLSLSERTLEIALDEFPLAADGLGIDLPMGPVREVLAVYWGDESDDELAGNEFVLDDYRKPNRIMPVATSWPTVAKATNAVKIRYVAGYGDSSDGGEQMPKAVRAAVLLMFAHLFENREATIERALQTLPLGVESLLRPHRVRLGMA